MSDAQKLAESYIAAWNETDANRRQALIARAWTDDARYVDPLMAGEGRAGIEALIAGVQQRFPDFRFSLLGKADSHNGRLRFSWALVPDGGEAVIKGTDFATISADGRLHEVTGFLDQVPAH